MMSAVKEGWGRIERISLPVPHAPLLSPNIAHRLASRNDGLTSTASAARSLRMPKARSAKPVLSHS